jgi:hypothetical protein
MTRPCDDIWEFFIGNAPQHAIAHQAIRYPALLEIPGEISSLYCYILLRLAQIAAGYFAYHAVPTNSRAIAAFRYQVTTL